MTEEYKFTILTIEDISKEKEIVDKMTVWDQTIDPQIYYLLKKIKELEERILKLENPKLVTRN